MSGNEEFTILESFRICHRAINIEIKKKKIIWERLRKAAHGRVREGDGSLVR